MSNDENVIFNFPQYNREHVFYDSQNPDICWNPFFTITEACNYTLELINTVSSWVTDL